MKRIFITLALVLPVVFTGCIEGYTDNKPKTEETDDDDDDDDDDNKPEASSLLIGSWQVDNITVEVSGVNLVFETLIKSSVASELSSFTGYVFRVNENLTFRDYDGLGAYYYNVPNDGKASFMMFPKEGSPMLFEVDELKKTGNKDDYKMTYSLDLLSGAYSTTVIDNIIDQYPDLTRLTAVFKAEHIPDFFPKIDDEEDVTLPSSITMVDDTAWMGIGFQMAWTGNNVSDETREKLYQTGKQVFRPFVYSVFNFDGGDLVSMRYADSDFTYTADVSAVEVKGLFEDAPDQTFDFQITQMDPGVLKLYTDLTPMLTDEEFAGVTKFECMLTAVRLMSKKYWE